MDARHMPCKAHPLFRRDQSVLWEPHRPTLLHWYPVLLQEHRAERPGDGAGGRPRPAAAAPGAPRRLPGRHPPAPHLRILRVPQGRRQGLQVKGRRATCDVQRVMCGRVGFSEHTHTRSHTRTRTHTHRNGSGRCLDGEAQPLVHRHMYAVRAIKEFPLVPAIFRVLPIHRSRL